MTDSFMQENENEKNDEDDTIDELTQYVPPHCGEPEKVGDADVEIAALTHPGLVREKNEDQYAVLRRFRSSAVLASSLRNDQLPGKEDVATWLLVVADGLGGHTSGEVASATAINAIITLSNNVSSWMMRPSEDELKERVKLYADAIQAALRKFSQQNQSLSGIATTITSVYLFGDQALVVNVGDSRAYLLREQTIQQITDDHTVARQMERDGASQAAMKRFRNLVTRSFNTEASKVEFDIFHLHLQPQDQLLLCSDGLNDMVEDDLILQEVTRAETPQEACKSLVQAALEAGGRDNITTVIARVN
ncbi:MAG: protein phosphatase 2C domain-containing protein [Rubripirellula sp.]|nr:protein phosphatase 2C domain-containing protein [Rubripirellula sp.]